MIRVFTEGQRKAVYNVAALAALCIGAWRLHATFVEFRDGVIVWLGAALAAHVVANKISPSPPSAGASP